VIFQDLALTILTIAKSRYRSQVEIRFRGTRAEVVKLRRMAQALKVQDVTEWDLEEKELHDPEEVSPELAWNSGGISIRGARGKEVITQKQLSELTGIANFTSSIRASPLDANDTLGPSPPG
jgi:hypothetical protein